MPQQPQQEDDLQDSRGGKWGSESRWGGGRGCYGAQAWMGDKEHTLPGRSTMCISERPSCSYTAITVTQAEAAAREVVTKWWRQHQAMVTHGLCLGCARGVCPQRETE
jgi:hypothetical protein